MARLFHFCGDVQGSEDVYLTAARELERSQEGARHKKHCSDLFFASQSSSSPEVPIASHNGTPKPSIHQPASSSDSRTFGVVKGNPVVV